MQIAFPKKAVPGFRHVHDFGTVKTSLSASVLLVIGLAGFASAPGASRAADPAPARPVVKSPQQEAADRAAAFMASVAAKPGVIRTSSGLCYEILTPGTGEFPGPTDIVKANYQGTLVNGSVFDTTLTRGQPVEFPLNRVIRGWTEGLQKVGKGGKIKLYVPPDLGYGEMRRRGIPPGSALIFEIEVVDFRPAP